MSEAEVVVVGSGPNGLAAGVVMAAAGYKVKVYEAQPTLGGGSRTIDLGLAPGIKHDICAAVHPMALASPFMQKFDLPARGVELLNPEIAYGHPVTEKTAAVAYRDLARTEAELGIDGGNWHRLMAPLVSHPEVVTDLALGNKREIPKELLKHPLISAKFGINTFEQGTRFWNARFKTEEAAALLSGVASHAIGKLPSFSTAGTSLMLGSFAHSYGWPIPAGGSQSIVDAMINYLIGKGAEFETNTRVSNFRELPKAEFYFFDTSPKVAVEILAAQLAPKLVKKLLNYKYGHAAAKVDFVVSEEIPWTDIRLKRAGTVHIGGNRKQLAQAEREVLAGKYPYQPVVLLNEPSVVDTSRVVNGLRPVWAYAHVPRGSRKNPTERIIRRIEQYAPGFRDTIVASKAISAANMHLHNENYIGGDIAVGAASLWQLFARPTASANPYLLAAPGVYLCSAATPPGPGVHGLGGMFAAKAALASQGIKLPDSFD